MNKKITVFGLGYVGCSMAALLSQHNRVIGIDIDKKKIDAINNKKSPVKDNMFEDFLVNKNLRLTATDHLEEDNDSDFFIIATPTNYDEKLNYFDTSSVENVIKEIKNHNNQIPIIIKSTIPIGFVNELNAKHSCSNIIFSPEFLKEGSALYDNLNPSRIIIGSDSKDAKMFANLLVEGSHMKSIPIFYTGCKEAECIKLFANTYLALRVAFFNELDTFGFVNKLDIKSVIEGISSDERIGNFYNNPSFGYGGYCLPKDTKQLLSNFKEIPQTIISAIVESNNKRKDFLVEEIVKINPKKVGIYLLAMKKDSDNSRSSAIQGIIARLKDFDIEIFLYEPAFPEKYFMNDVKVFQDIDLFKSSSDLIITNRFDENLLDVKNKVFTRDIFGNN